MELVQAEGPLVVTEAEGGTTVADIMGAIMVAITATGAINTGEMPAETGIVIERSII